MCGILAIFNKEEKIAVDTCDHALNTLKQRGPDFSFRDVEYNGHAYIGQTVLSITGSPTEIEKYHKSKNGRFNLIFNGEIYNFEALYEEFLKPRGYKNMSGTDTEVLVNLHEVMSAKDIYDKLEGMFGYIIYDNERKSLLIGRDMIGEKVLYFLDNEKRFMAASEVGPILELNPDLRIDKDIIRQYFFTRHLLTPTKAAFKGIQLIQPGSLTEYDLTAQAHRKLHSKTIASVIDPIRLEENKKRTQEDLAQELEVVMQKSAKAIAPKQAPFSCVLSGGVDSSLASFFVAQVKRPNHLVALQFPQKDTVSEHLEPFEKILGQRIEKKVVDKESFKEFLQKAHRVSCSPLPTHSFVSQAIVGSLVKNLGDKVWIGGHGGDEVFGGYEAYKKLLLDHYYPKTNPGIYSGFVAMDFEFENWSPQDFEDEISQQWQHILKLYDFEQTHEEKMIQSVLYSDLSIMLESVGIREADTMSMLSSVEPRCFFLTKQMLEFALNLPAKQKVDLHCIDDTMVTRPLIKKVFINKFGAELLLPKQGFSGFPNEAGQEMVDTGFPLVQSALGIKKMPDETSSQWRAAEWKLINTEIFLQQFSKYL